MIKKKLWSEESDFSEYTEDEEVEEDETEEEDEEVEDEEEEDEENEDEEEQIEDEEEEEEVEDEYNEIEEIDEVEKEDEDGLILVEEDVIKQKRKREYILNKKEIEIQKNKFNYNNMSEEEFINNIKQYLEKITTQKNSEILVKNIIDSSDGRSPSELREAPRVNKNKESKLYRKEILDKVNHLIYFYSGSTTSLKSIKEIQTDIKNNNIGFYNTSDNNFWDIYRESIKKEVNKIKQPVEVVDGLYSCSKCKGTITQSYSIQTRRSDEPPTVFIHCMNKLCLHKWREG